MPRNVKPRCEELRIPIIAELSASIERALSEHDDERAETLKVSRGKAILLLRMSRTREVMDRHLQAMEDLRVFCMRRFNDRVPS